MVRREPSPAAETIWGPGEPQLQQQAATRTARIANAIVLVAFLAATTTATATNEPEVNEDGSVDLGECLYVNPWSNPPSYHFSVMDCIPPIP